MSYNGRDPDMKFQTPIADAPASEVPPRLLDQVRHAIRYRHYSYRTEQAYVAWCDVSSYITDGAIRRNSGADEVEAFLRDLAVAREVSASTHQQALSALVFLYREVL